MAEIGALLMGRATAGSIADLVAGALSTAAASPMAGNDVYLDGGALIRDALDAALVDDWVVSFVPAVLGAGHPLFAGAKSRHAFDIQSTHRMAHGMLQLHLTPR
jgi:dihydrofolate reductase